VDDAQVLAHIEELVAEEHRLRGADEPDVDARRRLDDLEVSLDRCWDLLRQRQARREFGLDPDGTSERVAEVVEGYEQ
jgi:hypothetical protein